MSSNQNALAYPALVVDGSAFRFFAGILDNNRTWLAKEHSPEPALESLFGSVDAVLKAAGLEMDAVRAFIYCEGPGSVLGLRLCAMALETWRRVLPTHQKLFAYNSLELPAAKLLLEGAITEESLLISDWKKDTWNGLRLNAVGFDAVAPIHCDELKYWQGPLYHLPARKGWQKAPQNAIEIDYQPEKIAHLLESRPEIIKQTERVTLFQSSLNTFQKWKPERHRAIPT